MSIVSLPFCLKPLTRGTDLILVLLLQEIISDNSNINGSWFGFTWGNVTNDNPIYTSVEGDAKVESRSNNRNLGFRLGNTWNRNPIETVHVSRPRRSKAPPRRTAVPQEVDLAREADLSSQGEKAGAAIFWQFAIFCQFALLRWLAKPWQLPWRGYTVPSQEVELRKST